MVFVLYPSLPRPTSFTQPWWVPTLTECGAFKRQHTQPKLNSLCRCREWEREVGCCSHYYIPKHTSALASGRFTMATPLPLYYWSYVCDVTPLDHTMAYHRSSPRWSRRVARSWPTVPQYRWSVTPSSPVWKCCSSNIEQL